MAHTFFRTFGLTKPSDADITDFFDALGLTERNTLAGLHALYGKPVLIFLEDSSRNVIAFFANSGLNMINLYPETRTIFEALLGATETVVLAYKPERFLRPQLRNSLAGRFFVPENFRFDPLIEAASAAKHFTVNEAPVVFKKSDIPDLYPYVRSSSRNFDIHQIENAVMKPVPLALSEKAGFPTVFSSLPAATVVNQAIDTISTDAVMTVNALTGNNVTTEGLHSLFARNPLACARFARAVEDSGLPVSADTASSAMKAASYLADETADYVFKALLARNPESCARIARQALSEYGESTADHVHSTSTLTSIPTTTSTITSESMPTPTSSSTPNVACTSVCPEPMVYVYDPTTEKVYRLVSVDDISPSTLPDILPIRKKTSDEIPHILMTEPKQTKETKFDIPKIDSNAFSKLESSPYDRLRRSVSESPVATHPFGKMGHLLSALNFISY